MLFMVIKAGVLLATISNKRTLKLKTSDFSEHNPCIAYSGDM